MSVQRGESGSRFGDTFPALLAAAQAGSAWAWERVYAWLAGPVAGYLRLQGAVDPDDVTSEVFIGVFRGIAAFAGTEEQFRSWVFVIAHRRLTDQRRSRGRRGTFDTPGIVDDAAERASTADVEDEVLRRLASTRVDAWCAALAPDQRDVLLLRVVADMTIEQVADAVGKSIGAVKALQRRGLESIRRQISRQGVPL